MDGVYICKRCRLENVFVIDSRKTDGVVRRRRKCGNCGYRFNTYEISERDYKTFRALLKRADKLKGGA